MEPDFSPLNIIDLISDIHTKLRRSAALRWEEEGNEPVSLSESHLLARIALTPLSISEAARITGISRQAVQKTAKALEKRGYLESSYLKDNKRDKYLHLTQRGSDYIKESERMKLQMEKELTDQIGQEDMVKLKKILKEL